MDRMGKKDLVSIVEKQKQQIARYETKLRDLVIAYKGLSKEKEALEASLKAISGSKSSTHPPTDENSIPEKDDASTSGASEKAENSKSAEDVESVEQLKVQLQTLTDSLATLSAEKSRMEARFQADKKQLRHERDERDKIIKGLEEKMQNLTKQHLFEMECVKSRLIVERHERDKERNDHAVMMRELQMLLSEERRTKEQLENQVEELKSKSVVSDLNLNQKELFEKRIRELQNELESVRKKLKKAEGKAKETPPALLELQEEMANMKTQHQIAILQEQKKAADAEEQAKHMAAMHEERVASLEARLAELSSAVGMYDRQLQQDQVAIQKLKDQLLQLNLDPTISTVPEDNKNVANPTEMKMKMELGGTNDIQSIIDKIFYLKGLLEEASKHAEKTVDFPVLWNHVSGFPIDTVAQHRACKDEYNLLKQEFELYKQQNQRQVPANLRNEDTELEISSLKGQIKSLKERIRILTTQLEDVEKEYKEEIDHLEKLLKAERANCKAAVASCEAEFRARLSLLEQQLQKQRERTLALLEEKDQEIQVLKSSFQSLLPRKTSSRDDRSWSLPHSDQVQDAETVLANLGNTSDSPHVLHYAHELARRDVEISSLRRERHQLEAALRELRRLSATDREKHADEVQSLQEEIDRLNRCQSREGANLEYLKNVVLCFLTTNESNSKKHMLNAIAAVLKFSDLEQEKLNRIHKHL
ncbi:GRIP and coiled-coil domain-containing protein 1 isoform X1 [Schistocerca cancellata]|uniref:GRIP and coiled-coil domain-containing protein 1 isoform X1 n=1 Tax=Schistocerca cancellata TaxID=274614 RepID=UPI00211834A2|nr:GRIP and coiled-coil domain-containing protein 1 isoform X1 [Schistocerca cancellata]